VNMAIESSLLIALIGFTVGVLTNLERKYFGNLFFNFAFAALFASYHSVSTLVDALPTLPLTLLIFIYAYLAGTFTGKITHKLFGVGS
jgi:hypothetical protein